MTLNLYTVNITDADPDSFEKILWFIYSGDIELDLDCVFDVYENARKINVNRLEDRCKYFISNQIKDKLYPVWNKSIEKNLSQITNLCKKQYLETFKVFDSEVGKCLTSFGINEVCDFLSTVTDISEIELFKLAQNWLDHNLIPDSPEQSSTTKTNIMSKIKFHLIIPHDLFNIVEKTDSITKDQMITALKYNHDPNLLLPIVLYNRCSHIFVLGKYNGSYDGSLKIYANICIWVYFYFLLYFLLPFIFATYTFIICNMSFVISSSGVSSSFLFTITILPLEYF